MPALSSDGLLLANSGMGYNVTIIQMKRATLVIFAADFAHHNMHQPNKSNHLPKGKGAVLPQISVFFLEMK